MAEQAKRRNPPKIPADTSPEIWRMQMDAMAALTVAERIEMWVAFNRTLGEIQEAAVRREHPDYDDRQVIGELVRRKHGPDVHAQWVHANAR